MIANLVATTNATGPSIAGRDRRQSGLRVMVVGDSMTHGQQGDYTWRYRIWQFFRNNGIDVQFVGPYKGTMQPMEPLPPQPPPLYGQQAPDPGPQTSGGYAADVDPAFLSNSNHFAVWGIAVAVDKGLIQGVLQANPADLILFMLGFNDLGWFYSDADGTMNSVETFINNARAANPNIKIALANIPQRSFINGRQDLIDSTTKYNNDLSGNIAKWNTAQSPIRLVHLEETYDCHPRSCPAGYDGLHPNAWGEFQIANAFSETLVNDFGIGNTVLAVPAQDDGSLARPLPGITNLQIFSSPQGVTATWDPVYGAYSYDVEVLINGGVPFFQFSPTSVATNRWDCQWSNPGWTYTISVRPRAGPTRQGDFSGQVTGTSTPELADPPQNVVVEPTGDGFTVTWDPPTGPNADSIVEYNIIYWNTEPEDCEFISGAAFTSSPAVITGLKQGRNYLVAPVTWNKNGQGLPFIANHVIPGAGQPPSPGALSINANDPTTAHMTWTGTDSTGGYHVWARNVNQAGSQWSIAANVTASCADVYFLFPGIWNFEFAATSFNGNQESPQGPAVLAPSPASGVTQGSTGPTCAPEPQWCPGFNDPGNPTGGDGGSPPVTFPPGNGPTTETLTDANGSPITITLAPGQTPVTGPTTITTNGQTITVAPVQTSGPTSNVQTVTQPDGSTVTLTLPPGSTITGIETITTGGSTITVGPTPRETGTVTSTMTTIPAGVSLQDFTDFPITSNIWITTTGADSSTTIVPVILPCQTCEPVIVWDTPEIPWVQFRWWPKFPELPTFHLPCIKIFGVVVSGQCPSPSGPTPVNDDPPQNPRPSGSPEPDPNDPNDPDEPEDDPCELKTDTGMCDNGNYPVFDPASGTMSCDAGKQPGQCQRNVDSHMDSIKDYIQNEKSCCPAGKKRGMMSSILHRGLNTLGINMDKRADFCPAPNQNPKQPPQGQCYATYTCPHLLFPNVCGNAKSAIDVRGATSVLTHVTGSKLHDTEPWYEGHYFSGTDDDPPAGWKLDKCQVEEYPFGSGNPNRNADGSSVLRLIPGGAFGDGLENQNAGSHLRNWVGSVAARYNAYQEEQTGRNPRIGPNGIVYCVDFDSSFTGYLPEDQVNDNFCASVYGPEFTLVNDYWVNGVRTWDPWFDVPNTNRKTPETMYYVDPDGDIVVENPSENDYAVYATVPSTYCHYPSPGRHEWDGSQWNLAAGYQAVGRMDDMVLEQQCTDPPPGFAASRKREVEASVNVTRAHPRDIKGRQSSGGFLDANVYKYMGCAGDENGDTTDGEGVDPCADDSNPCPNVFSRYPTTNGGSTTQVAIPPSNGGGVSTGPITHTPTARLTTTSSTTAPSEPTPTLVDHTIYIEYSLLCIGEGCSAEWTVYQGPPDPDYDTTNICDRDDYQHEDDWFVKDGNVVDGDPPKDLNGINTFDNNGCNFHLDLTIDEYRNADEGAHVGTMKCPDRTVDCINPPKDDDKRHTVCSGDSALWWTVTCSWKQ
ncbi:hypothetical protein ONS95_014364 [Cadophora gregata]|nr:uncharacterized protein ONS95_014364 [Cadophora gregata]KAK0112622.1 hypothetical protein ONS95_014364 [Cadophora gregata]